MVVPDTHHQHHSRLECVAHSLKSAHLLKRVGVAERSLLRVAEVVRNRVVRVHAGDVDLRVLDDVAVLYVQATDLSQITRARVVGGDKLGNDSELGTCVDSQARAEERLVTHTERVEVAAVLVTHAVVPVVTLTAVRTLTASLACNSAYVRSNCRSHGVRLPDVHLDTARSVLSGTGIRVITGRPAFHVGL